MNPKDNDKCVLLINRFPYWVYNDSKSFLQGINNLCILHSNESQFDFPVEKFNSAIICNFNNIEELEKAIDYLYETQKFNCVLNLTEPYIELAAKIRKKYSIEGMDISTAIKFRNKLVMKKTLSNSDILIPKYRMISSEEDIINFFETYGKSVIKPIDGMGTNKTFIMEDLEELKLIINEIDDLGNYEIEEFIEGEMFHCDSVIVNGEIKICSVSKYLNSTLDYKSKGYLSSVMIDDYSLYDRIKKFNKKVLEIFKYNNGVTHLELFLSNDNLVFCEIAARAGGAGVIPSIKHVYGVNLFEADLKIQLQQPLYTPHTKENYAGWLVFHNREGLVIDISSDDDFQFDWIYYKNIKAKPGDLLTLADNSVSSLADFTITGTSEKDVIRKIEMVKSNFKLSMYK